MSQIRAASGSSSHSEITSGGVQSEASASASAWALAGDASFTFAQSTATLGEAPGDGADPDLSGGYTPADGSWPVPGQEPGPAEVPEVLASTVPEGGDLSPFSANAEIPFL